MPRWAARGARTIRLKNPIVESLMLGNIAIRTQEPLEWTRLLPVSRVVVIGHNALLMPPYRAPWSQP